MNFSQSSVDDSLKSAARLILNSEYVVALTGAGFSVESGIPPFRGPGGLWTKYGEPPMNGYRRFLANPKEWWEKRMKPRRHRGLSESISNATPNQGHIAMAELEKMGVLKYLITQNIDNMHLLAGSQKILEIHGNSFWLRCIDCGSRFPREGFNFSQLPPSCPKCGGLVKSDTVMFGEPIPPNVLARCFEEAERSDCMLVAGTSASVQPAASLPIVTKSRGGFLIEINPRKTEISRISDVCIRAPSGEVLPRLVSTLKR